MRDADDDLDRRARRRAGAKMGWYLHAGVYVVVMTYLAVLSALSDKHWAIYPALGWGLGLVIHGVMVFLVSDGTLHARLVERERRKLRASEGPW